ncbi:MAG: transketolase family protein [Spirochaetaceae bacterium]|jgi:transketolase|nr:transketolase family protein [Spirochaetaceae bacterium]
MTENKSLRVAYGEALAKLGAVNERIVVLDADLAHATMTSLFAEKYPDRFYNFGVAEANMAGASAGFAFEGFIPFVSTFALFGAGRAYEIIRNAVAYAHANVKFAFSHSGLSVGEDGGSHQSVEDIALMRAIPGMTIFVPCDPRETEKAVNAATALNGPVYIRVARPVCPYITGENDPFVPGKAVVLREGAQAALFATGLMVAEALEAAKLLENEGVSAAVVNFHTIKPFDKETALEMARKTGAIVTVEEHSVIGGLGSAAAEALAGQAGFQFARIGINDRFGKSGTPKDLFREYGLTAPDIARKVKEIL